MKTRILRLAVNLLTVVALLLASCGPQAIPAPTPLPNTPAPATPTPTAPSPAPAPATPAPAASTEKPRYGGTLNLYLTTDITDGWDDIVTRAVNPNPSYRLTHEPMWITDWARGNAGGHGSREADLYMYHDVWDLKTGLVAESWKWSIDDGTNEATIVYKIRQGIRWALNQQSEASKLVGGRELTADDVVFSHRQRIEDTRSYFYRTQPRLRGIKVNKTGPWEVTITKIPVSELATVVFLLGDSNGRIFPPEVVQKYGDMGDWRNSVGSGPFMVTDFLASSMLTLARSPNYWMKDPVGPGKGNQLPYIDVLKYFILPDVSTQHAAFRTGRLDVIRNIGPEDADQIRKTTVRLPEAQTQTVGPLRFTKFPIQMRQDKPPFQDIRVRKALMLATNFDQINKNLLGGAGQIVTFPWEYSPAYAGIYVGLNDPDMPGSIRDLYTYNPERAKQLLKEAGYPNGFKTEVILTATEVDYWSVLKEMWGRVNIELDFKIMEPVSKSGFLRDKRHQGLTAYGFQPHPTFYELGNLESGRIWNLGMISDRFIDEEIAKIRLEYAKDQRQAMKTARKLSIYIQEQVYAIPTPYAPAYTFWWPWLKNYTGEDNMGYHFWDRWTGFVWMDTVLKKSMGY